MTEFVKFQELWSDIDPMLQAYRDEVRSLRESVSSPTEAETAESVHTRLITARRVQDRVEYILANVGLARSRVRKLVIELQEIYDEAWADTMNKSRVGEYASAQERNATYMLGALEQKRNLHKAKLVLADIESVYEFINIKYRGLDSVRNDAKSTLRMGELESHLER